MFKTLVLCCLLPIIMAIGVLNKGLPNIGFPNINDISDLLNDQVLSPMELAQNARYEAESYEIVTQDGYILQLDRITSSSITPLSANRTPVLLLHGILDCSVTWIAAGPGALGYTLADQGYDVWLGNVRGNRYSRKHLNLTTLDPDFWMFSWHEMGIYDLPAVIDHITEQTGQEKIFMVTHSQGGIAFFVMASERPEYQEKVIGLSALAPAVFMSRAGLTLFQVLSLAAADGNWILNLLGIHQFMPSGILLQSVRRVICPQQSPLLPACEGIFDLLFGKFRKFDYGVAGNMKKYGQEQPPDYNLGNVSVSVQLYYGTNDIVADAQDVLELYEKLPSCQKYLIQTDNFAHLDFLWGNNVNTLIYNKILNFMEQHRK